MFKSIISGMGSYVPPNVVTNDDLAKIITTSDEWIFARSGIKERRYAGEGVYCSDLALEASKKALEDANLKPSDLDFIIYATLSPDHFFPGSSCYLQTKLGIDKTGCLDVRNQCTGFLYSMAIADAFIRMGMYKNILVVGAEIHSNCLEFTDLGRNVTVLFGDAAGAAIFSATEDEDRGVLYTELHADGKFAKSLHMDVWDVSHKPFITHQDIDNRNIWPKMDGKTVFKNAVTELCKIIPATLEKNNVTMDDVKYIIPHQANLRINQMIAKQLEIPDGIMLNNIEKYGNTTAASIPLLLDETYRAGMIEKGDLLLFVAFGAGFTWASALMRW